MEPRCPKLITVSVAKPPAPRPSAPARQPAHGRPSAARLTRLPAVADHRPAPPTSGAAERLHALEHAVEEAVEQAIEATERSLARRFGDGLVRALRFGLRAAAVAAVVAFFAAGALLLATRYLLLPRIDEARPWLERQASAALGARLSIGRIEAGWRGFHPHLALADVRLVGSDGQAHLALPRVDAVVSWSSALWLAPHFRSLSIAAPQLEVRRLGPQRFSVAGFVIEPHPRQAAADAPLLDWVLEQRRISVRDARIDYIDQTLGEATAVPFEAVRIDLIGGVNSTRLALQATPPAPLASRLDVRGEFRHGWFVPASRFSEWQGRAYVDLDGADLARTEALARLLPPSMRIERAHGALRAWAEIDRARLTRLTADVALAGVRAVAGEGLEPIELESVRGRFVSRDWGNALRGGRETRLQGLSLQGEQISLPQTDLRLRTTRASAGEAETRLGARAQRTEFEASRISLDALTQLAAHVPLARDLRSRIARQDLRGTLSNVRLDFDGEPAAPDRYALRSDFEGLSSSGQPAQPQFDAAGLPRAGQPGFANLRGTVDLTESGGRIEVGAQAASLEFPGVFRQPKIGFDRLAAQLRWTRSSEGIQVELQNLAAANADLEVAAHGSYRRLAGSPRGVIDLNARVGRLEVAAAPRYAPLVAGALTLDWLGRALADGRATDGTVRLAGDLYHFPFRDPRQGEFRASVRVRDGRLDYLPPYVRADGAARPGWPALDAIDADVVFERQGLTVTARSASIFDTRVANAVARIDDLHVPDARLFVRGSTQGPAADLLRYVRESGLREPLHFLTGARASADARMSLRLDIPLAASDETGVGGAIELQGNDVELREDILPFTRARGRIEFTRHSIALSNLSAGFAGGQLSASGATRPDGSIVITGSGSAAPAAVARQVDLAPVRRLLARAQGLARYGATLTVRHGGAIDLRVDSDLAGWAIDAPAPLAKSAAETLPLRVELADLGTERSRIAAAAGAVALRMELARAPDGSARVARGVIAAGTEALLPAQGFVARIDLPSIDVDAWRPIVDPADAVKPAATAAAAAPPEALAPDQVHLRARELRFAGRRFDQVRLDATRQGQGNAMLWSGRIDSEQVAGTLQWRPAAAPNGHLGARLTRLALVHGEAAQAADRIDPSADHLPDLDLTAESFEIDGRALGRLELAASHVGTAAQPEWSLRRLALTAPEARLNASGRWLREPGQAAARMGLAFALEFDDAGALLTRLGVVEAMRRGQGRLEGELNWRGSPLALHPPTLAGKLRLNTSRGQFLRIDAGAGRLLGVLSLQALPRRIALDFRDVFSEGFAFDSITATAEVAAGVLSTSDFRMRGASASVLLEGSVDLGSETQNLRALVLPAIDAGSASLAYAMLANPAIGLGAFVAQFLLREPLAKAFSFEYDITGTWDEPQVRRRERPTPEPTPALN